MAQTLVEETWSLVLDDEQAEEAPCRACHGRCTDRWGEDCAVCGGIGVDFSVNRRGGTRQSTRGTRLTTTDTSATLDPC